MAALHQILILTSLAELVTDSGTNHLGVIFGAEGGMAETGYPLVADQKLLQYKA